MAPKIFKYSNGEVTIVWQPELCIHSGRCVRGLPDVFKPKEKPWITPERSTTEKIINQVKRCPSGALSYFLNEDASETK
ncbi:MAG TPA: (4Fe-4S)-binding protein [Chitinophagaceae bacterium]